MGSLYVLEGHMQVILLSNHPPNPTLLIYSTYRLLKGQSLFTQGGNPSWTRNLRDGSHLSWYPLGTFCSIHDRSAVLLSSPSLKKSFIYLFLERGEGREKGAEKHQCVVASCAPSTEDLAHNPGMCPDWESNQWPFGLQAAL